MSRYFLLLGWLLFNLACTKESTHPTTPDNNRSCKLETLEYFNLGTSYLDSLIYVDGKIKRVHSYMGNNRFKAVRYTYFGKDSIHLSEAYPGNSEHFLLTRVYGFDSFNRLVSIREHQVNETTTYVYLPNDSIQLNVNQLPIYMMHKNASGNIHFQRSLIGQNVVTVNHFDSAPNPFEGMLHNAHELHGLSANVLLNETITENGQPFWQRQWTIQKNEFGHITQWDDGNTRIKMTYSGCP